VGVGGNQTQDEEQGVEREQNLRKMQEKEQAQI
jgi:hypothetical protein